MTKALRMSTMFLRTLREDPADADVVSDKLLQRACYLRKAAPGIWTWLPLGLNVLNKIENIIRGNGFDRRPGSSLLRSAAA